MSSDEHRTAVGYTRLSQTSDLSIDRQKRHIKQYCDDHGITLRKIFNDGERSSGFKPSELDEYQALLETIQDGDVDVLITNDKRRTTRDYDEFLNLTSILRKHGVEYHTYRSGNLDINDAVQSAIEVLQAAVAFKEKKSEIEKSKEAVQERVADENTHHGRAPVGMQHDNSGKQLVPDHTPDDGDPSFSDVIAAIKAKGNGASYSDVREEYGITKGTMSRIMDRKELYMQHA